MITTPDHRIEEFTRSGWWSDTCLHQTLTSQAGDNPELWAVVDPPNRPALTGQPPQRIRYRELVMASVNLAAQLHRLGLRRGDTVLLQMPNIVELVVVYFAASRLGIILSPAPMQYRRHELKVAQRALLPKAMISVSQFQTAQPAELARQCLESDIQVLAFGNDCPADCHPLSLDPTCQKDSEQLLERESADCATANAIITICWTSGTTGEPKGVPRSHNMWRAIAKHTIEAGQYQAGDQLLNPFPLVNMAGIGGFLYPFVEVGGTLHLHHPFDPPVFLKQMADEGINFTIVPPAVLNQLASKPEMWNAFDFSQLRRIGSGSAPLAPWMVDTFDNKYGKPIVNFYGSNEGIALFSTPEKSPDPTVRATMFPRNNHLSVGTRVVAVDTEDDIDQPGIPGELLFFGPTVFDGYTNHEVDDVFTVDGWFRTGDLVEICSEAPDFYRIVGRCKDIINRGGMKISPSELDILLEAFPGLKEAAVCAYPDPNLGERICACVVPMATHHLPTLEKLCGFLEQQGVAKFKLPERLLTMDALPRNAMGKVQRNHLEQAVKVDMADA